MQLSDICWVYNETESIIFSWAKEEATILNSKKFLLSRLFTTHDAFSFTYLVKYYDGVIQHLHNFIRRKELLYNSTFSKNLSHLLNTSFMHNYSDFKTEIIKLILQEYNDWKNILIEVKMAHIIILHSLFDFRCTVLY